MQRKSFIGLILIAASLIIVVSNVSITGAVIGAPISNSISFVALTFFLVGALLLISERRQIESRIETLVKAGVVPAKIEAIQEGVKGHYKRMSKEERKAIYNGVAEVIEVVQSGARVGGTYNLHKLSTIPPSLSGVSKDTKILEADAKVLNGYVHQGGRGTERYIFNSDTGELLGIAYHPRGNARDLAWRKRF